ncbi:MAG: PD40 domain-containing protein [Gemmatimonadetes bacterium]|nr:PD40 domain-containing protein [Gemmatimonadota bacterium]
MPDGEHLLFVGYRRANVDLFLIAPDGKDEVNLTNSPENESNPVPSPDGSQIAYFASADGKDPPTQKRIGFAARFNNFQFFFGGNPNSSFT